MVSLGGTFQKSKPWISFAASKGKSIAQDRSAGAYSDGALNREPGIIYGRLSVSTDIRINRQVNMRPVYIFQLPSGDQTGRRGDYTDGPRSVFGLVFSAKF